LDACVAPGRILSRHPHDQAADLDLYAGPTRPAFRIRPFPGDELAMPAENCVRRDNRRHLRQLPTTETHTEDSQAPPFVVGQPHELVAQLRLQDPVLFAQVLDSGVLLTLEPADEKRSEQLQRNHAPSLRQPPAAFSDTKPNVALREGLRCFPMPEFGFEV
jgi:hypothetical protein